MGILARTGIDIWSMFANMNIPFDIVTYDFNIPLNVVLLLGNVVTNNTIPGLKATDLIVEIQPTANLPGNLGIAYAIITADNSFRVVFSSAVALTFNGNAAMRLTVLRYK